MEIISDHVTSTVGEIAGAPRRLSKPCLVVRARTPPSPASAATPLRPILFRLKRAADWIFTHPVAGKSVCSISTTTGPPSAPMFIRTTIGPPPVLSSISSAEPPSNRLRGVSAGKGGPASGARLFFFLPLSFRGEFLAYTYDQLNRLTGKTYPDSTAVNYTYDNDSRLTQVSDPTGTYQFTLDNMGRLTGTTTSYTFLTRNFTTSYAYDKASNRTGFTDPENGSTSYVYDTLNRLQTLTPPTAFSGTGNFGFSYDVLSRRTQMTRPNSLATNYSYDNLSRLLGVLHQSGSTTLDGASYGVDNAGNRTTNTDQLSWVASNYTY